jgi:hypothetical protein
VLELEEAELALRLNFNFFHQVQLGRCHWAEFHRSFKYKFSRRLHINHHRWRNILTMGKDRYYPPDGSGGREYSSRRKEATRNGERKSEA